MKEAEIICLDHPYATIPLIGEVESIKINDKCNWMVFDLREERFYPRRPVEHTVEGIIDLKEDDVEEGHTYNR